jgi:UDP-N-acetylglucosamine 2-epimerase (non-hydrolysing)
VLTDSGGIQEETTYLGIPCFTLRDNTERPVTIRAGTNTLLGLDPSRITQIPELLRARPAANRAGSGGEAEEPARPDLWDGKAAERVADVLADW